MATEYLIRSLTINFIFRCNSIVSIISEGNFLFVLKVSEVIIGVVTIKFSLIESSQSITFTYFLHF